MFDIPLNELYWVAGFLEGEGSFCKCGGTIQVAASQVQKEPIDRLYKLLGGGLNVFHAKNIKSGTYNRWNIYGKKAEALMKLLFPIMSPRRQNQITMALAWYASCPGVNFTKSGRKVCRKGHAWTKENIYIERSTGSRYCKICRDERLGLGKNRIAGLLSEKQ